MRLPEKEVHCQNIILSIINSTNTYWWQAVSGSVLTTVSYVVWKEVTRVYRTKEWPDLGRLVPRPVFREARPSSCVLEGLEGTDGGLPWTPVARQGRVLQWERHAHLHFASYLRSFCDTKPHFSEPQFETFLNVDLRKGFFSILDTKPSKVDSLCSWPCRGVSFFNPLFPRAGFYSSEVSLLEPAVGQVGKSTHTRLTTQTVGRGHRQFCSLGSILECLHVHTDREGATEKCLLTRIRTMPSWIFAVCSSIKGSLFWSALLLSLIT